MITFIYLFTSSEHDPVNDCVCQWLSCVQLYDPMDCSPPGSSVHGIAQARILEWAAIPFSREFPDPGIFLTQGSNPGLLHCRQIFTI